MLLIYGEFFMPLIPAKEEKPENPKSTAMLFHESVALFDSTTRNLSFIHDAHRRQSSAALAAIGTRRGQEADLFVLLTAKEELTTRDGKPYFKVAFRDHAREVSFPIWNDSAWAVECRDRWRPGMFYKLRAVYRDTNFGPQLDIKKNSRDGRGRRGRRLRSADVPAADAVRSGERCSTS